MGITFEDGLYHTPLFWLLVLFISVTISLPLLLSRVYRHCYLEPSIYAQTEIDDPLCGNEEEVKQPKKKDKVIAEEDLGDD